LPKPIADFFREDDDGLAQLFSEDATVIDAGERKEMSGRTEITQWIEKSISGLDLQTNVRSWTERDGEWVVGRLMDSLEELPSPGLIFFAVCGHCSVHYWVGC
jgi:hypothetical protein